MADKDVTAQSEAELAESLAGAKKELFNLRFQHATGQLENTARIPQVKRHIARINTELRARELASGASS